MKVIFKIIKDFPDYAVTNNGCVYSLNYARSGRIKKLKQGFNTDGYLSVVLYKNKTPYNKRVNRIVAEAFILNQENKTEVNHRNGIKTDNRVENLEWVTRSENCLHKFNVLGYKSPATGKRGILCKYTKIIQQIKNGRVINTFYGAEEANRITGINAGHIRSCCYKDRKTAGGYRWRYK